MKKSLTFVLALSIYLSFGLPAALAAFVGPGPSVVSVAQAKDLRDDSPVILQGYIEKQLGGDDYSFKDDTGSIVVEIKHSRWNGLDVTPKDKVEITGEVDKDLGSTEIEVHSIKKI